MTEAVAVSAAEVERKGAISKRAAKRPGVILLVGSLVWVWLMPRRVGRMWVGVPLWMAFVVALACTAAAGVMVSKAIPRQGLAMIGYEAYPTAHSFARTVILLVCGFVMFLVMLGFAILPFVPRAGPARPVVRQVARAVMLGSTMVGLWWVGIRGMAWVQRHVMPNFDLENRLYFWLAVGAGLLAWTYVAMVRAAAVEYRGPGERAGTAREPRCDECGYDLRMMPMEGRCPECGKAVAESLGEQVRPVTEWEREPSFWKLGLIGRQWLALVLRPLEVFRVMPITTGLPAARKWLGLMLAIVFVEAFWVMPSIGLMGKDFSLSVHEWTFYAVGLSVAVLWTFLGVMMVGIETAGVTIVSRWKRQPIEMAHAAKVTCYSSTLLFVWVILGAIQVDFLYWWEMVFNKSGTKVLASVDSMVMVGTFGAAHIAGLVLFEYTVYRGLRAVMYAVR